MRSPVSGKNALIATTKALAVLFNDILADYLNFKSTGLK
jgi:hypothetical protein